LVLVLGEVDVADGPVDLDIAVDLELFGQGRGGGGGLLGDECDGTASDDHSSDRHPRF